LLLPNPVNHLFLLIARHRYLLTFLVVLSEAIGLPVPAALALVAAGAGVASKALNGPLTLGLAFTAMLIGDTLLFVLGRYMGWALLAVLCKLSVNPESCVLRSAESFYKRGKLTLLFAKFVPGVNTMAPPLAGSMKMRPLQFLRFDLTGATLYILAYGGLGFLFHDFLAAVTRGLQTAGHVFGEVLLTAAAVYTGYRVPLIVVSPYTKENYVSHTVADTTAILKLIETRFNLPALTKRDAAQMDMTEFFDFNNPYWLTPPSPPAQNTNGACYLNHLP